MKKSTLLLVLSLAMVSAFGQRPVRNLNDNPFRPSLPTEKNRSFEQRMIGFQASDNMEYYSYTYNEHNQLIDIHSVVVGSYETHDSVRYNANGQLVRIDGYQYLNDIWKHVYYLEYTYNEQGQLASRANYNSVSDWTLGGLYEYYYNPDGQIIQTDLTMGGRLFQSVEYSYIDGLLVEELWSNAGFGTTSLTPSEKKEYAYTDGKLTESITYFYDNGFWDRDSREEFQYDADGNCTLHQTFNANDAVVDKSIFTFNNQLLANTLMPITPETERPKTFTNVNTYLVEEWHTLDANNVLQYVCDYLYDYDNNVSIREDVKQHIAAYPNPCHAQLTIQQEYTNAKAAVYDIFGKLVTMENLSDGNSTINLSACKSGIYFIRIVVDGAVVETIKVVKE